MSELTPVAHHREWSFTPLSCDQKNYARGRSVGWRSPIFGEDKKYLRIKAVLC
ncbi:MAG: hypothetical protein GDA45_06980 [Chromatiales bacterium]|nr:hypothetical protein [Chromatiales bacterium]